MCTLTWFVKEQGYELFFNRDERNTRQRAQAPTLQQYAKVSYLSPTDTDAGGTWIASNHFGVTVCLLNYYRFEKQFKQTNVTQNWVSRGEIVRLLAPAENLIDAETIFKGLHLQQYQAFRLFIIQANGHNRLFIWDSKQLIIETDITAPKSSSSVNTEQVKASRYQLFDDLKLSTSTSRDDFLQYHASHYPTEMGKSAHSVCMHRDDANTVSMSHINVNAETVSFGYTDGAPCSEVMQQALTLNLV